MRKLEKYSIGIGDRFGYQGKAQLEALIKVKTQGVNVTPIWNKSFREHTIIKSQPIDTLKEANEAVKDCKWKNDYFIDADHIGMKTVNLFIDSSNFFTIDVADFIGEHVNGNKIEQFVLQNQKYIGQLKIPNIEEPYEVTKKLIEEVGQKYLIAIEEANRIYRYISKNKNGEPYIIEASMDETDVQQSPIELFFILAAIAHEKIPIQTIAPRFPGRFNKGVDYVGDISRFTREFEEHLAVIDFAIQEFSLLENLKLSVHSGSDKFSIYKPIRNAVDKFNTGFHLKTAGTTWLEELIGLAEAGGEGLEIAKDIYRNSYNRFDELCKPYASVIDIQFNKLPAPEQVDLWNGLQYAASLRHNQENEQYNPNFRQLLHVGYKVAAEMGERYTNALKKYKEIIAKNVTENIYERHLKRLFL